MRMGVAKASYGKIHENIDENKFLELLEREMV